MTTSERLQKTAAWLENLNATYGFDGVVHEVASVIDEGSGFSRANLRYRQTLVQVMEGLIALYDETGNEKLLDASRDIRRLIEWADSGTMPIQMALWDMPKEEAVK